MNLLKTKLLMKWLFTIFNLYLPRGTYKYLNSAQCTSTNRRFPCNEVEAQKLEVSTNVNITYIL